MRDNYGGVLKPESIIKKEARGILIIQILVKSKKLHLTV